MSAEKTRFTLDLDPPFQKRLKVMAALKGVTMRQYCIEAIGKELAEDEAVETKAPAFDEAALERLAAARKKVFKGRTLPGDSTEYIREAREAR